ncbi:uncharacterized protein LOC119113665 [Pollicipes pollicipes]|uniref:uncharacterized protein LOC119113665 n=1 Tax=Pollicipes pollicipes TaxID=41117 RepID=UPI001884F486|nr:uncharacterized protein LOC119113665 [Pollicipes pollicipes]
MRPRCQPPSLGSSNAYLVDVKVGGKFADDRIYNHNLDILQRVARGNCVLKLSGLGAPRHLCLVHALRKFTGSVGDEDDTADVGDDATWRRYFLRPPGAAARLVVTHKVDGDAAHLSARWLDGGFLVCVGSKNVHLVLRREADIELYRANGYQVAKQAAAAAWRQLAALGPERRRQLLSFLHHTRFTAVCELLQPEHQHVEDFSHLTRGELRFIAWAPPLESAGEAAASLCGCSPELGFRLADVFGLTTVTYSVVTGDVEEQLPDVVLEVRKAYGFEGKVLYFVDSDDNVIGMLKKKTVWYVMLRSSSVALGKHSINDLRSKISARLRSIQASMCLTDEFIEKWIDLSVAFAIWRMDLGREVKGVALPQLWARFLRQSGCTDRFPVGIGR